MNATNPAIIAELLPALKARVAVLKLRAEAARCAALGRVLSDNGSGPPAQPQSPPDPELGRLLTPEVYGALDSEAQADCLSIAAQVDLRSRQLRRPARLSDLDGYAQRRVGRLLTKIAGLGS